MKLTNKNADVTDVIINGTGISSVSDNADKIPTLTVTLGAITPSSINGVNIIGTTGKTLNVNNSITLQSTDGITIDFGAGGTISYGSGLTPVAAQASIGTGSFKTISGINGDIADQIVINLAGISTSPVGSLALKIVNTGGDYDFMGTSTLKIVGGASTEYNWNDPFSASTPNVPSKMSAWPVARYSSGSGADTIIIMKRTAVNIGGYDQYDVSIRSTEKDSSSGAISTYTGIGILEVDTNNPITGITILTDDDSTVFNDGFIFVEEGTPTDAGGGAGTVTSVGVIGNDGIVVSNSPVLTAGNITLDLGNITPTTVNGITLSGSSTPTLAVTGTSSISGGNTGDQLTMVGISSSKSQFNNALNNGVFVFQSDALGTPTSGTLTNCTGLPISGTTLSNNVKLFLTTPTATNLETIISDKTGSGDLVFNTSPVLVTPVLGTPASVVLTNASGTATGLTAGSCTVIPSLSGVITTNGITNVTSFSSTTGSGATVLSNSPNFVTPILGVATATSINKVTITPPATGSTLTIADGKTLIVNQSLTLTGSNNPTAVNFGTGGTVVYTTGSISGSAGSLNPGATINGVNFTGSSPITVTADASTLTGTVLKSTVLTSSLTTVGTIGTGIWRGTAVEVAYGGTGGTTAQQARTNILPSQSGQALKYLRTDGTDVSWQTAASSGLTLNSAYYAGFNYNPAPAGTNDPTLEIIIYPGNCRDSSDSIDIKLQTSIIKSIAYTWASGITGTAVSTIGGMANGVSRASDQWYRIFIISNSTGTILNAGFDTDSTALNLRNTAAVKTALGESNAANIKYRQLGFFKLNTASPFFIRGFNQVGRKFYFSPGYQFSTASPSTGRQTLTKIGPPSDTAGAVTAFGQLHTQTPAGVAYLLFSNLTDNPIDTAPASGACTFVHNGSASDSFDFSNPVGATGDLSFRSSAAFSTSFWIAQGWDDSGNYLIGTSSGGQPIRQTGYFETNRLPILGVGTLLTVNNPYYSDPTAIELWLVNASAGTIAGYLPNEWVPINNSFSYGATAGEGVAVSWTTKNGSNPGTIDVKISISGLSLISKANGTTVNILETDWDLVIRAYFENEGGDYADVTLWDSATSTNGSSHQYSIITTSNTTKDILFDTSNRDVISCRPYLRSLSGTTTEGYTTSQKIYLDGGTQIPSGGGCWVDTSLHDKVRVYFPNSTPLFYVMNKTTNVVGAPATPSQYGLFVEVYSKSL